jgi:dCMP deaminase
MDKWKIRFGELAKYIAGWSKDKSTKVAAIIVNPEDKNPISMGFNGFPAKVNEDILERHERPLKYLFTVHGEINAIANAAKNGQKTKNCDMYVNYFPCCNCAGAIVNAGIKKLICENKPNLNDERWGENWKISLIILTEGGVEIEYIS